jgi:hypothetical protein
MALPTAEQLADPEFIRQFMDACTSDKATARTLEMVNGDLWKHGQACMMDGEHVPLSAVFISEPGEPEDALECADCGAPCDPRELFCDGCLDAGSE